IKMKILVAYYSFEGNTKYIAEAIAKEIKADILEIKPEKEVGTKGFFKYPIGGFQVVFGLKPKLKALDKNPEDYDVIFIGTPTWALNLSPPIRSFLKQRKITDKKIALFCCRMGNAGRLFKTYRKLLPDNEILGEIEFSQPLTKGKEKDLEEAAKWAKDLIKNIK
ncbi:MAG: flavodoxin family protein, partial [Candidatus Heimdallarchaeota archaeon]